MAFFSLNSNTSLYYIWEILSSSIRMVFLRYISYMCLSFCLPVLYNNMNSKSDNQVFIRKCHLRMKSNGIEMENGGSNPTSPLPDGTTSPLDVNCHTNPASSTWSMEGPGSVWGVIPRNVPQRAGTAPGTSHPLSCN